VSIRSFFALVSVQISEAAVGHVPLRNSKPRVPEERGAGYSKDDVRGLKIGPETPPVMLSLKLMLEKRVSHISLGVCIIDVSAFGY